ncbi:Hypothetical predicted protein [Mytilus galloprovincialis]|uniref:Uncharacterized protein n=1 Tax=Mytilus galloprovincialis TaxID=29158 RepID=A0A8B6DUB2_MYTGA|nr:Hypothetical predicted protein [Mytilus galloprovincialis]
MTTDAAVTTPKDVSNADAEMTTDAAVTKKNTSNAVSDKSANLSASIHNDNDSSTGLVVGMVIGGLLLAIGVVLIVVLIRRKRFKSKPAEKMRTNLGGNDYIGSQDIALPQTANHSSHMQYFDKQTSIDDEYATVDPFAETNLNEIKEDGNQTADSYMILDPNDTGFNRTAFSHISTNHEFSKAVKDTGHKIINDDPYDISVEGVYDQSENNRHKELEVDIYNHAVDTFYDSGSHKRNDKGIEDTYDHFFGQKTDDDYDVSTTT